MENINKGRLFLGSCLALITTAMTFAIRARLETVFGPEGVGLTLEQIGYAFTPAFFGFTLAMIFGGPMVDFLGIKKITWIAFITHAIGIVWTIMADSMTSLFLATLFVGIGNGMVEAALNPMVASMYSNQKTKMLNRFHVWFPGGIVIGSIVGWLVMDVMGLSWQIMVATLFVPLFAYAILFFGQQFPVTERVQMGISNKKMFSSVGKPLFIFMVLCMFLTAASELGTTQRIESLLKESVAVPLLVLAFINGIMALGRLFAGQVVHKLKPSGMLLYSAIFTFIGLWLLTITSGGMTFVAAAVFAVGVTFFWPTMLGFVAEYLPETGALGLSIMGGAGMFSVSLVLPVMGKLMDDANAVEALRTMSILPAILIVAFIGLNVYMKKREKLNQI
ncbi:MFS transporter [Algibacter amylolyticus]|uniref:MFS transporter n=1 Tax=Algibacter amylolyticus TaxID=1608400 RepID=A0A5M7BCI3_9FLAO|nr:MFS transporter [Algibacter amylolyticus]KAA5826370.1 MFS transporter [Algibacter amylolyticus]MBB5268576.1 MFS family permease [Algibacter amylolyticus]TSJ80408.1 MFS transporter [Algibacter amylolyticus]